MEKPTIKQMNGLLEHLSACDELDDSDKQIEQMANQIIALLKESLSLVEEVDEQKRKRLEEVVKYSDIVSALKAENRELKGRYIQAINDETELPGPMPEALRNLVFNDPESVMRSVVRATKNGIIERIEHL